MKTERQHTRDRRENRFEREEKFAEPMETLPGKTLRDRTSASRSKLQPSTQPRLGFEMSVVSRIPPTNREPAPVTCSTSFRLYSPLAQSVQLAGTFNDWNPEANPLSRCSGGEWEAGVPLKPGTYEYKFIVDGVWQEDPAASDSVANPFGSRNSVKHVG
jgi:hypothetical protein